MLIACYEYAEDPLIWLYVTFSCLQVERTHGGGANLPSIHVIKVELGRVLPAAFPSWKIMRKCIAVQRDHFKGDIML